MSHISPIESMVLRFGITMAKGAFNVMNLVQMPSVAMKERNITFHKEDGAEVKLDVVKPEGEGPFPIILLIHGGGFIAGDKVMMTRLAHIFASEGYLVFNANYRLSPEVQYPEHIEDCMTALQWVKNNAQRYQGDLSRICVGGGSAGCYLSAALAVNAQEGRNVFAVNDSENDLDHHIHAVMLLNGVFDLKTVLTSGFPRVRFMIRLFFGDRYGDDSMSEHAGIINKVNNKFPKSFIAVGKDDSLYGQSTDMHKKLLAENVNVKYHDYPDSGHGWFNAFWKPSAKESYQDMLAWLNDNF